MFHFRVRVSVCRVFLRWVLTGGVGRSKIERKARIERLQTVSTVQLQKVHLFCKKPLKKVRFTDPNLSPISFFIEACLNTACCAEIVFFIGLSKTAALTLFRESASLQVASSLRFHVPLSQTQQTSRLRLCLCLCLCLQTL